MTIEKLSDKKIDDIDKKTDYIICNLPDFYIKRFKLTYPSTMIFFYGTRLKHAKRHKDEFTSEDEFYETLINLDAFISNPDYVGINPTNGSIQIVKRTSQLTLVAVQFEDKRNRLEFKTMFPITESKLERYLDSGNWLDLSASV